MANYKVGMRVRIVSGEHCIGREATITAIPNPFHEGNPDCRISVDGEPCPRSLAKDGTWSANFENLAPLAPPDPKADAFIEQLRKLGSEPHPVREVA